MDKIQEGIAQHKTLEYCMKCDFYIEGFACKYCRCMAHIVYDTVPDKFRPKKNAESS